MSRSRTRLNFVPRGRQRGIATILIVLLVGMALTATAIGVVHAIRSTQQRQLSVHSSTPAQATAWRGVEVIRTYLSSSVITDAVLTAWAAGSLPKTLTVTNVPGFTTAQVTAVTPNTPATGTYQISVNLTGSAASGGAAARSLMEVVYLVVPDAGGSPGPTTLNGNYIFRDLDFTNSTNIADGTTFNVGGDVTVDSGVTLYGATNGSALSNVSINSTGDVTVAGGTQNSFAKIHTNGDVYIGGSASAAIVETLGDVFFTNDEGGSGFAGTVTAGGANTAGTADAGNVTFQGGGISGNTATTVNATGDVVVTKHLNIDTISAQGLVNWTGSGSDRGGRIIKADGTVTYADGLNLNTTLPAITSGNNVTLSANGRVGSITTLGNSSVTQSGQAINRVDGSGSLTVTNQNYNISAGTIGGTLTKVNVNPGATINVTSVSGYSPTVTPVSFTPATEVSLDPPQVDVYALKDQANYAFTVDSSGYIKVLVEDVAGVTSKEYYYGMYSTGATDQDYLCETIEANSPILGSATCKTPAKSSAKHFCTMSNAGPTEHCLISSTSSGTNTFTINTKSMADQIMPTGYYWFDGNLIFGGAKGTQPYHATFMATLNITSSNYACFQAPNFTGVANIVGDDNCTNRNTTVDPYAAVCQGVISGMSPTQLCGTGSYTGTDMGNTAFLAGGCETGCATGGTFEGGTITITAGTTIYGNVVADNLLTVGGSKSSISGYVAVTGQNTTTSTAADANTEFAGQSSFTVPTANGAYQPTNLPTPNTGGSPSATVLWTRYR